MEGLKLLLITGGRMELKDIEVCSLQLNTFYIRKEL